MAWDDFGFNSDYDSVDAFSGGSWSPEDYSFNMPSAPMDLSGFSLSGAYQPQMQQPFSLGGGMGGGLNANFLNQFSQQPQGAMPSQGGMPGQSQFSLPPAQQQQPGAGSGGAGGGLMGALPGLLGLGGGLAGIAGQLIGGGQGPQQQRTLNNAGQGALNSANSQNSVAAQGNLPLQQMQMSLLQALQSGQGLPPGYEQLIEQAFQPKLGSLYEQAANQGRARGFHDAPATSPPGGAILGPGLADIQGQQAQAKLSLMQSLPQTFQNPINTQIGALNNASAGLMNTAQMNSGQQSQQSIAPMIGNAVGGMLQGAGQAMRMSSTQGITYSGA